MALETYNLEYSVTTTAIFVRQPQIVTGQPWTIGNTGGSNIFVGAYNAEADATLTGTETQIKALKTTVAMIAPFSRILIPSDVTSVGLVTGTGYTSTCAVYAGEQDAPGPVYVAAAMNLAKNDTRDIAAAPGANTQLWVYGMIGTADAQGTVLLLDDTPTSQSGIMPVGANGGWVLPMAKPKAPWVKCSTNKKLQATLAATNDWDGIVIYAAVKV